MRVVADTNVIISALVFGGVPRKIFELAESRFLDIFYSPDIQAETRRILLQKFGWDEPRMDWYLARLWNLGKIA